MALTQLPSDGEIWITSSVGTAVRRISPCVAQAVGRRARISGVPSDRTVSVVLVHEWGFPHPERDAIVRLANDRGWRVVDDCAHAFRYGLELAGRGSTVAFSFPKLFPVAGGGLLANPTASATTWNRVGTSSLPHFHGSGAGRLLSGLVREVQRRGACQIANWLRLRAFADASGLASVDRLVDGVVPQAFRLAVSAQFAAGRVFADEGIETTPPFYTGWIAVPCHSELDDDYWRAVDRALVAIGQHARTTWPAALRARP
ncbi:MAG: DegT/DnrJ/EryC1/StrS family aminotransferase [Chloroflexota bacterium]